MVYKFITCILIFSTGMLISCNSGNKEYLPTATGKPGDVIMILDSVQWRGELGSELRKIFREEVQGLPREESMFNLTWVYPRKGSTLLTQIRNLIIVFTLDQNTKGSRILREQFTQETLDRIQGDTSFYLVTKQDEYSRGQEVMYLFSNTEESLIKHLKENGKLIQNHFNNIERKRIQEGLIKTSTTKGVTEFLRREQDCEIRIPFGYKLADKQVDFIWFRQMDAQVDKNIFISWKKYESEYQLLPDSLINWRNNIAKRYLFEYPEQPDSYLVTETSVPFKPIIARQVNFNDRFAMELRGLWKTNNNTMGGPFISYSLVDEAKGLIYYIEGFCYSPGKNQRETIRELEAILWTFQTSAALAKGK
jgi:hypothetical protein